MEVTIRKAVARDAVSIWEIRNASIRAQCAGYYSDKDVAIWTDGVPTERFVQSVVDKWHVAVVARAIVGTGVIDCLTGHIDGVFVSPDLMGHGIGTAMMRHLQEIAARCGLENLSLDSTLNAAAFYRKCGFTGERISQYHSPRGISLACIPMVKQVDIAGYSESR